MKRVIYIIAAAFSINCFANSTFNTTSFHQSYQAELAKDAILNLDHPGFKEDYLVLHCLLKKFKPATFLEIGTCEGMGTKVIKNALPDSTIYSLELTDEQLRQTDYFFLAGRVGVRCNLSYIQLRGDSMTYDYKSIPGVEGWFIDGYHDYAHVLHESTQAFYSNATIIIWHDTDIPCVFDGVKEAHRQYGEKYDLYRVSDTRIAYAVRKGM
jgi:hypothetical protein